ncbi:uncharacterized protein LOC115225668 [Octopus sinensis]|uniref:Uncharacterized protein LOC115225668 n=1 Tax=Octopus sinensis TaxID=2607531 RepID=A0A7E6FUG3_9MOLL|nr:uncharacterized protein LOC115225668 [Octopus sinensis]
MLAYIYISILLHVSTLMQPTIMAATIPVDETARGELESNMVPDVPLPSNLTYASGQSQVCNSSLLSSNADEAMREKSCSINTSNEEVNKLALCPWRYVINRDVNRVPQDIKVAKCLCGKCAEMSNFLKECRTIYKDMKIFRLNTATGSYQPELEMVPIACGCGIYSKQV